MPRLVVVGFSGGVTSAWCAGWALRNFPREEVVLLWHDTKEEDPDTYRFLHEMAAALGMPITERSDGRSVTQLFYDEGYLGNNQHTFCSRILKAEQGSAFVRDERERYREADPLLAEVAPLEVLKVIGYSAREPDRVAKMVGRCAAEGITPVFPIITENVSKQECYDWCACTMGVRPSAQYEHFEHANCMGCVKGGRAYWLKTLEVYPGVFEARALQEEEFGHEIIRGGDREHVTLRQLVKIGLKRKVNLKERVEVGACECGD